MIFFLLCVFGGLLVNVCGVCECVCVLQDMVCGGKDNFQKLILGFHNLMSGGQTQSSAESFHQPHCYANLLLCMFYKCLNLFSS